MLLRSVKILFFSKDYSELFREHLVIEIETKRIENKPEASPEVNR